MWKKCVALLLGTVMIFSLAGCGDSGQTDGDAASPDNAGAGAEDGSGTEPSGETVISFYSWSENAEQDFDKAIIDQYEKENPGIKVEAVFVPYGEYLSKMNTMAAAGSMPDVFKMPEANVLDWGTKGALLDLRPMFERVGITPEETMLESTIFKTDDSIWGAGCNVATLALYYNKELFTEAGIEFPSTDAEEGWSWSEFVENAKRLTKDGSGKTALEEGFNTDDVGVYGTMMPTDWNIFSPLLYTNESGIASADGRELEITSERGIEVIQSIADLALVEQCAPILAMAKGAFADKSTMLMNGQVAMLLDGSWALSNYANEGFDVGIAQIPYFSQPANMSWTAAICMAPESADNQEAFDFFCYYTDFNNAIHAAKENNVGLGGLPHTLEVFDGGENEAAWKATYTSIDESENCETFKNILNHKDTRLGENVSLKNFPSIVDNAIVPLLDNVWLGEQSAREALGSLDISAELDGTWN